MAWAEVTVGDAIKASDLNNLITALENMLLSTGYLDTSNKPAATGSSGTAGHITYGDDAGTSYIYVCTATDTWKRVALATW